MDPLSNLHLRPSEQALVKIVNINMDKTKISEFIREQRMATDKATGVNLHNNKYHTQCLITFGNLKYDISIMMPPLCCVKRTLTFEALKVRESIRIPRQTSVIIICPMCSNQFLWSIAASGDRLEV